MALILTLHFLLSIQAATHATTEFRPGYEVKIFLCICFAGYTMYGVSAEQSFFAEMTMIHTVTLKACFYDWHCQTAPTDTRNPTNQSLLTFDTELVCKNIFAVSGETGDVSVRFGSLSIQITFLLYWLVVRRVTWDRYTGRILKHLMVEQPFSYSTKQWYCRKRRNTWSTRAITENVLQKDADATTMPDRVSRPNWSLKKLFRNIESGGCYFTVRLQNLVSSL